MPAISTLRSEFPVNERSFQYYGSLRQVRQYVTLNYSKKITLAAAAHVAGMERTYFSAFFHRKVGIAFRDWLRLLRIEKATSILVKCDEPIPRVARSVGFDRVRSFQRAFKKYTHQTPAQYQRRYRP